MASETEQGTNPVRVMVRIDIPLMDSAEVGELQRSLAEIVSHYPDGSLSVNMTTPRERPSFGR